MWLKSPSTSTMNIADKHLSLSGSHPKGLVVGDVKRVGHVQVLGPLLVAGPFGQRLLRHPRSGFLKLLHILCVSVPVLHVGYGACVQPILDQLHPVRVVLLSQEGSARLERTRGAEQRSGRVLHGVCGRGHARTTNAAPHPSSPSAAVLPAAWGATHQYTRPRLYNPLPLRTPNPSGT